MDKNVLLVSIAFSPNIGGIETHFDDLVTYLDTHGWKVDVLTYTPITTNVKTKLFEKRGKEIRIYRMPWFRGAFYTLMKMPALEFLFLIPGLFVSLPLFLLTKGRGVQVIHSHGLAAGFVSVTWGKIFRKRIITTTHSIYHFPKTGLYRNLSYWIFNNADRVLTLSQQSAKEIKSLGIAKNKITIFTYWIDQKQFAPQDKKKAKTKLGWKNKFTVLFVGRFVKEKGVLEMLEAAKGFNRNTQLVMIGTGPLETIVENAKKYNSNMVVYTAIANNKLPIYYAAADVLIVPSIQEEGFGRVILEALACGTPVIGSNRGAIPEAIDETVGKLVDISVENIVQCVYYLLKNKAKLKQITENTRRFAEKRYSSKNAEIIIKSYYE